MKMSKNPEGNSLTHRCPELLSHNRHTYKKISIRFEKTMTQSEYDWQLKALESDEDWDNQFMAGITSIQYCPFCGAALPNLQLSREHNLQDIPKLKPSEPEYPVSILER